MPSPFPGVDPYIEASGRWMGFHNALITYCNQLLNLSLPSNYAAVIEERLELVDISDDHSRRLRGPDVGIIRNTGSVPGGLAQGASSIAEIEPTTVELPDYEEVAEAYIEIISLPRRELVTRIEVLSPSNKSGTDGGDYLAKRAAILRRGVNLVEIDLLLGGHRLPARSALPAGDYYAFVSRAERRPNCEVYAWSIRRALPRLPIPLKVPDPDVMLDLAAAFTLTYDAARYDSTLQYELPPPAALTFADEKWVEEIVMPVRPAS